LIEILPGEGRVFDLGVGLEPVDALAVLAPELVGRHNIRHWICFGTFRSGKSPPLSGDQHCWQAAAKALIYWNLSQLAYVHFRRQLTITVQIHAVEELFDTEGLRCATLLNLN
jgi:hypothetical protein